MSSPIRVAPRRLIGLLLLLLVCTVPALVQNTLFGYMPLLFLLSFCLISLIYGLLLSRMICCQLVTNCAGGIRGQQASLSLTARNPTPLLCVLCRPCFTLVDSFGTVCAREELSFTLAPREERQITFQADLKHVGIYHTGVEQLWVDGLLGVVSFAGKGGTQAELESLPASHALNRLAVSQQVPTESSKASQMSSMESLDYAGVREYAYGDPIKRIHWKLSSHAGGYLTKLLESYGNNGLTILLDLCHQAPDHEVLMDTNDILLECAVSLGRYAAEHGMESEWLSFDRQGQRRRSQAGLQSSLSSLLTLLPDSTSGEVHPPLSRLLQPDTLGRYSNSNLAVCTGELDEATASDLLLLRRSGKQVILFLACPRSGPEPSRSQQAALNMLRGQGISCCLLEQPGDLGKGTCL